ncbi:MAG: hypothetical protein K1X29_01710 [Bdellovibrionales bacterium]|nr:hypothetical protein [Bdellovibrionales bacterium]
MTDTVVLSKEVTCPGGESSDLANAGVRIISMANRVVRIRSSNDIAFRECKGGTTFTGLTQITLVLNINSPTFAKVPNQATRLYRQSTDPPLFRAEFSLSLPLYKRSYTHKAVTEETIVIVQFLTMNGMNSHKRGPIKNILDHHIRHTTI